MTSLRNKTITALKWTAFARVAQQLMQFLVVLILMRILTPQDFGLVAMVTVITGFINIFGELGLTAVIVQRQDITDGQKSSAFWLTIVFGVVLAALTSLFAPIIALFYGKPVLFGMTIVISVNFIFSSFSLVQQALLKREMAFKALTLRDVISQACGGITGIVMAILGAGVWALVAQSLVVGCSGAVLIWNYSHWRPKLQFKFTDLTEMIPAGGRITGFNCVNYFGRNADSILIGKFLGAAELGFYGFAYRIMMLPLQNVSGIISTVFLPAFSKIQSNTQKVGAVYLRLVKAVAMVAYPLMAFVIVVAPELVSIFFGEKWRAAVVPLRVLCFCGAIQSVLTTTGTILLSQDQSKLYLELGVKGNIVIVAAIIVGLSYGINGVALAYTLVHIGWWAYAQIKTNRAVGISHADFVENLLPPAIGSSLLLVLLFGYKVIFPLSGVVGFIAIAIFTLVTYAGYLVLTREVSLAKNSVKFKVLAEVA